MSWRRRSRRGSASSNGVVQLRGDKDAAYGDVVAVMDELAASGVSRIAIVSSGRRAAAARRRPRPRNDRRCARPARIRAAAP